MRIVTAADSNFFDHLIRQVRACREHLAIFPDVYDLGMTINQRYILECMAVALCGETYQLEAGMNYPNGYKPRGLHKPYMLTEYCDWHPDEDVLYLDADAMPVAPFEFPCVGIGLTKVSQKKMEAYEGKPIYEYVGPYHSGAIFLGKGEGRDGFVEKWRMDMANDPLPSDKKSLNRIAKQEQITELDPAEWNAQIVLPHTKIFHAQGLKAR